jgi:hypothetical protein
MVEPELIPMDAGEALAVNRIPGGVNGLSLSLPPPPPQAANAVARKTSNKCLNGLASFIGTLREPGRFLRSF